MRSATSLWSMNVASVDRALRLPVRARETGSAKRCCREDCRRRGWASSWRQRAAAGRARARRRQTIVALEGSLGVSAAIRSRSISTAIEARHARCQTKRQDPRARANLEKDVVGRGRDRVHHLVRPDRLEKVLSESLPSSGHQRALLRLRTCSKRSIEITIIAHHALLAERLGLADTASVKNERVRRFRPLRWRQGRRQAAARPLPHRRTRQCQSDSRRAGRADRPATRERRARGQGRRLPSFARRRGSSTSASMVPGNIAAMIFDERRAIPMSDCAFERKNPVE